MPAFGSVVSTTTFPEQSSAALVMTQLCSPDITQTIGVQTKVAYTYGPVPQNSIVNFEAYVLAVNDTFTLGRTGYVMGTFIRGTGNLALNGVALLDFVGGMSPAVAIAANTSTQSIEVRVTGIIATTINYRVAVYVKASA